MWNVMHSHTILSFLPRIWTKISRSKAYLKVHDNISSKASHTINIDGIFYWYGLLAVGANTKESSKWWPSGRHWLKPALQARPMEWASALLIRAEEVGYHWNRGRSRVYTPKSRVKIVGVADCAVHVRRVFICEDGRRWRILLFRQSYFEYGFQVLNYGICGAPTWQLLVNRRRKHRKIVYHFFKFAA